MRQDGMLGGLSQLCGQMFADFTLSFLAAEMGCLKGRVSQGHGMPEVSQYHEIIMGLQMAGLTDLPRHEGTARSLIAARKPAPAPDSPPARVAFVPFCRTEARPLEDRSDDDWEFVPR